MQGRQSDVQIGRQAFQDQRPCRGEILGAQPVRDQVDFPQPVDSIRRSI
jgi:hypothetical protein